jgi:hypothetical protein
MFLIPNNIDFNDYIQNMNLNIISNTIIIEIETIENSLHQIHFVDSFWLNCNGLSNIEEFARKYWKGVDVVDINTEVLFRGEFIITNIIEQ